MTRRRKQARKPSNKRASRSDEQAARRPRTHSVANSEDAADSRPEPQARRRIVRWWLFWVALFSQRESGTGLAVFRIAIGLVLLYSLLSILAAGLIDVLWLDIAHGGYGPLGHGNWLLSRLGGPGNPSAVYGLYIIALLGALATTIGFGGRIAIFITLQTYNALVSINPNVSGGYDLLLTNALWLLVLADATATHSVRCRRKTGKWTQTVEIPAWPRYLIVFQLLVVYTATGLYKLSADWTPAGGYSALYHVFQDPTWRRFSMEWTASIYPLTQLATAIVWHFETGAWLMFLVYYYRYTRDRHGRVRALFNRWDVRKLFVLIGGSMHAGILLTMNVGPFSWVTLAYYICFFQPNEIERVLKRISATVHRLSGRRSRLASERVERPQDAITPAR